MPGMDIFRRSMPQSYNWVCMKGPKEEKAVEHTEVIEHRRKSFDKEGRRENLIFMGRSIQNLLVMNKAEENVCASERFNESYTSCVELQGLGLKLGVDFTFAWDNHNNHNNHNHNHNNPHLNFLERNSTRDKEQGDKG